MKKGPPGVENLRTGPSSILLAPGDMADRSEGCSPWGWGVVSCLLPTPAVVPVLGVGLWGPGHMGSAPRPVGKAPLLRVHLAHSMAPTLWPEAVLPEHALPQPCLPSFRFLTSGALRPYVQGPAHLRASTHRKRWGTATP